MSRVITTTLIFPTDPALPPPPHVVPDFQDPYTLRPYNNVSAGLSLFFAGIFILLRLYTKIRIFKQLRWEDYTCVLGFLGFAAYVAVEIKIIDSKGGTHQWNITKGDLEQQQKFTNYLDIIYSPACLFIKYSLIFLMLRLFCPQVRDPFYWVLQGLNLLNTIFYVIYFFIPFFACTPREKIWIPSTPGKCLNIYGLYMSSGAFNVCSDLAMFFVPLWRIWHLNMTKARRMGISAIFLTGGLAVASSIVRLTFATFLLSHEDYSYTKVQSTIASYAELSFGIICSCLFVLPRLYRHLAAVPPYGSEALTCRRCKNSIDVESKGGTLGKSKGGHNTDPFARSHPTPFGHKIDDTQDSCQREFEPPTVAMTKLFHGGNEREGPKTWLHLEDTSGSRDSDAK